MKGESVKPEVHVFGDLQKASHALAENIRENLILQWI